MLGGTVGFYRKMKRNEITSKILDYTVI